MRRTPLALILFGAAGLARAQSASLDVPLETTRSGDPPTVATDAAARRFAAVADRLTERVRADRARAGAYSADIPFSLPMRVRLTRNGVPLRTAGGGRSPGLTLQFDPSFPASYRTFLQGIYDASFETIESVYGPPAISGTVVVQNYDASIGDRDAVAGGYYLPNDGNGQRVIRLPIYSNDAAAAVNFLHSVLLAYAPDAAPAFDAFYEGPVRAAVMRVARIASAVPGVDPAQVEAVLENSYDVSPRYDWLNSPGLSGPRFIAPNLRDVPLPVGGSLGGAYLARYQMAGTAFEKVLAEHPNFLVAFNALLAANPAAATDRDALVGLGDAALRQVRPLDPTVEGLPFAEWAKRQAILDTDLAAGPKLALDVVPITNLLANEAGAFLVQGTYFETLPNGNETLLSGASYPVAWNLTYDRLLGNGASDRVEIAGAYGAYAPSFDATGTATSYRAALDFPAGDRIGRVYVPVGTIRNNDLYGTVVGAAGSDLVVTAQVGAETFTAPVAGNAFGVATNSANFAGARTVLFTLSQGGAPILTRRVNKGPGPLYVDLRVAGEGVSSFPTSIRGGLQFVGAAVDPFFSNLPRLLPPAGNPPLAARWDPSRGRFRLFPESGAPRQGDGFFLRTPNPLTGETIEGRTNAGTAIAVALKPGWNMITNPLTEAVSVSALQTVRTDGFPRFFADAAGNDIGADFFGFLPGATDPASGRPEGGSFAPVTRLEPGTGYYVRGLAPEGLVLLFRPASVRGRAGDGVPGPAYTLRLGIEGEGEEAAAELSADAAAARWVTPAPPGFGGLAATIGWQRRYRDVVPLGLARPASVVLSGLRRGRIYKVTLEPTRGRTLSATVRDGGRTYRVGPKGLTFVFRADRPSRTLAVTYAGAAR